MRILSRNLLLFLGLALFAAAQNLIVLKTSVLDKSPLKLADIVTIEAPSNIKNLIASLQIPSRYRSDGVITQAEITKILANSLIDTKKVKIVGQKVVLFKKATLLTKQDLQKQIEEFIQANYPHISIKSIDLPKVAIKIPSEGYHIAIKSTTVSFAHIYLRIKIFSQRKVLKSLRASVAIERFIKAAVATKKIPKGTVITDRDITTKKVRLKNSAQKFVSAGEVLGAVAKRDIGANVIIKEYMIEPNYAVKRKRSVKIIYQRDGIHIELLGLALENGNVGDIIRVKNLSSNKVLRCKVLSNGVVGFVY
ncbi:flagella basal body P-ring formation protein FlgA [Nitratiruptor sp. YY08-26]|uniref:flagellar basal body P-ring formation chaperone FlgA n=1 Tax=unclassified Nitratiruptor TaxID=2624044 RepID=UPI001915B69A|nr:MULTISPECIES: flagellar basal body P-ring formation chaperone FlgA [unclassified Nitratiruptor]BCD61850.1 flagella basal body P-ring formation protein FlgA [Nitratiruptor sp. YY08-13]BCD65785.1 flagella basal body P-ring formation protein FlgA [Nitratiruptor sp. YY08-26]